MTLRPEQIAVRDACHAAYAADDAYEKALKAAGYKSRWDWSAPFAVRDLALSDNDATGLTPLQAAYVAKVRADRASHRAWERLRERPENNRIEHLNNRG